MDINEILDLQVDALAKTICDYSTDNYIRNYANKLKEMVYPKDKKNLLILTNYLIDWYKIEIENIKASEYILSKDAHLKSYSLLCVMKTYLEGEL